MKKYFLFIAVLLISISANSQKKKSTKRNQCYIETAVNEFSLSDENRETLEQLFYDKEEKRTAIFKKVKEEELTREEGKTQARVLNRAYFTQLANLTGKTRKEITAFEKTTKQKCK